jgi:hypothetical protein
MRFVDVIEDVGRARNELRRRNLPAEPPPLIRSAWHREPSLGQRVAAHKACSARARLNAVAWNLNRQFALTPVLPGEPHRQTFSRVTDDGSCGDQHYFVRVFFPSARDRVPWASVKAAGTPGAREAGR